MLTARQQEVLEYIKRNIASRGKPPSLLDIAAEFDLSCARAGNIVADLVKAGAVYRESHKRGSNARTLRVVEGF